MRRAPSWSGRIYIQVLLAYHLAVIWLKVAAPLRLGRTVICDRYVFDSIVDLQQELGCDFERARHMLTAAWIPRPDYSFYFSLPAEAAFSRKTDTASIQFLQARSQLYRKVVEVFSLRVIDASQPLEQVQEKVFSQVFQRSLSSGSLHA
jgi:dTMP kinase